MIISIIIIPKVTEILELLLRPLSPLLGIALGYGLSPLPYTTSPSSSSTSSSSSSHDKGETSTLLAAYKVDKITEKLLLREQYHVEFFVHICHQILNFLDIIK
jgi:hypothetical protein